MQPRDVFVTGATGYIGAPLVAALLARGHAITALTRQHSAAGIPAPAHAVIGDALDATTYQTRVPSGAVFVHLVGVAHPSPAKARQFESIDLASVRASIVAAKSAQAAHFVYISVAHPAPAMRAYVTARVVAEALLMQSGVPATILRPWYVLGPGHRWPCVLLPIYWLLERFPATRESALRLGLVTHAQMIAALVNAVETAGTRMRIMGVPEIRNAQL